MHHGATDGREDGGREDDTAHRAGARDVAFDRLFDRIGAGIAVATIDGRLRYVNERFCETVKHDADQLVGTSFIELTHPEDRPRNLELIGELLQGHRDSFTLDKRYLTPDGTPVWVRANVATYRGDDEQVQLIATTEDITQQQQVEARLEQSQALLRIAGAVGQVGGWAIDADPVRLYWSDEVHDLTGVERGATPPLDDALSLYPEPGRSEMAACVERCLADGTPFDLEAILQPRDGEQRWVRVVGEAVWDDPGTRVVRVQGAIMDITDHRRVQARSQELADRLTATMESITDALYTLDTAWRFTYVNHRAEQLLERAADELLGRSIWDEFPATVASPLDHTYRRAAETGATLVLEEYHYQPLERYFTVHVYPSEQGLAVYFRDVTDARADRLELEERGNRLEQQAALLDEAQDAIVVRDMDGRISYWNRGAERMYGWTAGEVIGRDLADVLQLDPRVHATAMDHLREHGSWVSEVVEHDRTGQALTVEARWTLVHDARTDAPTILSIDTDITQRKQIELQFLRSQRMESIGKLAGGIAHDLNNSLAPIQISIGMLRDDETDPDKLRMLELIETSARRGADMVEQVLSFARGVGGDREPVAVAAVLEEVRRICVDTFPKNIRIDGEIPPDLFHVLGDATQLQQVLLNLSVNARDAMPDGGTLTLRGENRDESRAAADGPPAATVALQIRDTGAGIPDEVLPRIFDPFFSTKAPGDGTGLGLSTSTVIVESHGGTIEVDSSPGDGTTFTVLLPADPATAPPPAPTDGQTPAGDGQLILVVDDESALRTMTRIMLERAGYRVSTAADGEEALDALQREQPALVVTDLMMPVMDGFELVERIRAATDDLPILATSGLYTATSVDRVIELGADRFLAKPFDRDQLLVSIAQTLATPAG